MMDKTQGYTHNTGVIQHIHTGPWPTALKAQPRQQAALSSAESAGLAQGVNLQHSLTPLPPP
jgi:hypothetical protein